MAALSRTSESAECMIRNQGIVQVALDKSYGNFFIFNELMYFQYVKKIITSLSPQFSTVNFQNEMMIIGDTANSDDAIQPKPVDIRDFKVCMGL